MVNNQQLNVYLSREIKGGLIFSYSVIPSLMSFVLRGYIRRPSKAFKEWPSFWRSFTKKDNKGCSLPTSNVTIQIKGTQIAVSCIKTLLFRTHVNDLCSRFSYIFSQKLSANNSKFLTSLKTFEFLSFCLIKTNKQNPDDNFIA